MDKLTIRPFQEKDAPAVIELASDLELSPWTLEDYRAELRRQDSEMIIVMNGSKPAGFIVGRRVPGSGSDGREDAEIYNLGVAREFQETGIGARLILDFIERCRRAAVRDIWLDVRAANAVAIRFYKKFGFNEFTVRRHFYRDPPDDGIVMKLTLG